MHITGKPMVWQQGYSFKSIYYIMPSILCSTHAAMALALKTSLSPAVEMPKHELGIHATAYFCIESLYNVALLFHPLALDKSF